MDRHRNHWLTSTSTPSEAGPKVEEIVEEEDDDENNKEKMNSSNIGVIEREHMFDKVVTPSDVGKLNRLVIPKQHAEKYFPLDNNSDQHQKGLLLNFEDSTGKQWRFRYSYWNSSQSYVMTKGWSRFVKDKKLDAGDIVSFQRGVGQQCDKFFIDWRRRPDIGIGIGPPPVPPLLLPYYNYRGGSNINSGFVLRSIPYPNVPAVWNQDQFNYPTRTQFSPVGFQSNPVYCNPYLQNHATRPMIFLRPPSVPLAVGTEVIESVPVVQGKRLRLFGVNMDCPINSSNQGGYDFDDSSSSASASSSSNIAHTNNEYNNNNNNNNNNNGSSVDPLHESLQLRLRSDHFQLHKGKSSSSSSMSLDFDF